MKKANETRRVSYGAKRQARRQRALERYTVHAPPAKVDAEYTSYKARKDEEYAALTARLARS